MADVSVAPNPLIENAIKDGKGSAASDQNISDNVTSQLGGAKKVAQDAQQLEQNAQMKPAQLEQLGFPNTSITNAADAAPGAPKDSGAATTAKVTLDASNRPIEVDYPNGMKATVTRDQSGQVTEADITGASDKEDDGTFTLQSDGLLHQYGTNGKATGVTAKPSDVQIASDGAVQVIAKQKVAFLNVQGYIDVDPLGNASKHEGTPPAQGTAA